MKLKEGFVIHETEDENLAVATGDALKSFNGLVRNNETANFIYKQLLNETTEEAIVDAMLEEYNAPREIIAADVHKIIGKMRDFGLLDG